MFIINRLHFVFLMSLFFIIGCVSPDDIGILDNRIMLLERQNSKLRSDNKKLSKQVNNIKDNVEMLSGKKMLDVKSHYAQLKVDIEGINNKINRLQGVNEETDYGFKTKLSALNKTVTLNSSKIIQIEQFVGLESSNKAKKSVTTNRSAKKKNEKKLSDEKLYLKGKEAFDAGNYEKAREIFRKYLKLYPKSEDADNAQFWSGEIYYREKWYEKAILEYQKVIENYSKGNKVPSALLKQGLAFDSLGEKGNSRLILKKLIKTYPKSNEAKIAKATLEK